MSTDQKLNADLRTGAKRLKTDLRTGIDKGEIQGLFAAPLTMRL
jgi:hypothetical protein